MKKYNLHVFTIRIPVLFLFDHFWFSGKAVTSHVLLWNTSHLASHMHWTWLHHLLLLHHILHLLVLHHVPCHHLWLLLILLELLWAPLHLHLGLTAVHVHCFSIISTIKSI